MTTYLKQRLGDAGAGLDKSFGDDTLLDFLTAQLEAVKAAVNCLNAYQDTIATATLNAMVADKDYVLSELRAKAGTTGTAGATTVQVHVNGVSKGEVTIDNTDADGTAKNVALSQAVAEDDDISLVVSAAPTAGAALSVTARLRPVIDIEAE